MSSFAKGMAWLAIMLMVSLTSLASAEDVQSEDLWEVEPMSSDQLSRTLYLNSTGLAYGVAIGAALILTAAIGLYLYDYYYGTARTDPVPNYAADKYYQQYYQDQSQYGQYAYADQSQYR